MREKRHLLRAESGGIRGKRRVKDTLWFEEGVRSLGKNAQNAACQKLPRSYRRHKVARTNRVCYVSKLLL